MQRAQRSLACSPLRSYTVDVKAMPQKYIVGPEGLAAEGGVVQSGVHDASLADDGPPNRGPGAARGSPRRKIARWVRLQVGCACTVYRCG